MLTSAPRDYSFIAPMYDHVFNRPLAEGHREIGILMKRLRRPGWKVLEVGVGSGLTLGQLPPRTNFTGIDVNEKMLSRARHKAARLSGRKIKLSIMNAEKMSFAAGHFDFVMAPSVITAVDSPERCLKEMIRVTKKGGHIAIIANLRDRTSLKSQMVRYFDPLTKKYLGFRTDIDQETFAGFRQLKLIEKKQVNNLLGFPLSTFLLFERK
jgi:phosphatidylethanolamine/phosphatidyl-N-methylethanolamine N-methyltransferase